MSASKRIVSSFCWVRRVWNLTSATLCRSRHGDRGAIVARPANHWGRPGYRIVRSATIDSASVDAEDEC